MKSIGFGVVGSGYMGKRHAVALQSVGSVFNTSLRPTCEVLCTSTDDGAAKMAAALGFHRSTGNWRQLVDDPAVEAIIIASPQTTHREIALAAFAAGKPVLCEKPLGASLDDARAMCTAANEARVVNMVGFNYMRTPASQLAYQIIQSGEIGEIVHVRAEHNEDFLADPSAPANWRTRGDASGTLGDLSPHMFNSVLRLVGPIESLVADAQIVHASRPSETGYEAVTNDDQANVLCRFANGAIGTLSFSRVALGRKLGYAFEIFGTKGSLRFDQEDQNALWFYKGSAEEGRRGFTKILTGPEHPDYKAFCLGPGHGTGYGDQLVIEARDFLVAIESGDAIFPTFRDGLEASRLVVASFASWREGRWVKLSNF